MDSLLHASLTVDFRVAEFYIAPASKGTEDEDVPESVYSSSGKYIDPVCIFSIYHSLVFLRCFLVVDRRYWINQNGYYICC